MKKIRFILLTILCCLPTIIFAAGKDTDSFVECWYENERIYYYYNATTNEFTPKLQGQQGLTYTSSLVASDFINKSEETLFCPVIYIATSSNYSGLTKHISITKKADTNLTIEPGKTNIKNPQLTTTKTCIYTNDTGHKIEFILDISKKEILSSKVNGYDANNQFTYNEIYTNDGCSNITNIYGACYNASNSGMICGITKTKPNNNSGMNTGETILNPEHSTGSSTSTTPDNNNTNSGNHATEKDFTGNLTCGGTSFQFPKSLPNFTNVIFDLLKIATPVIIIITGMMDMFKAVAAQKEDEIKKGQQKLLRRLLAGAVVFLVFVIVETAIHAFADSNDAQNAMDCVDCFLVDSDSCTTN